MNKNTFLIILALCLVQTLLGQNIHSALHHFDSNMADINNKIPVEKIIQETTFYNENDTEIEKTTIILNDSMRIVNEERYNEKYNRKTRIIVNYDSTQIKSISRLFITNQPYIGTTTRSKNYEYDNNNFLIKITDKENNKIYRITKISNNERGNPIKLEVYENSIFFGTEIAEYDYDSNSLKTTVYNSNAEIVSTNTGKINYDKYNSNYTFNENGDLIQSKLFRFEYKYDKNGNWKRKKRYMLKNGKWVKNALFVRSIKYRKHYR